MSAGKPVVVIVDDVQSLCEALQHLLATVGLKAQTFRSAQEFMSAKRTFRSVSSSLCDCPG